MYSSLEEAQQFMDQIRAVSGKENIIVEVGRVLFEASGLIILTPDGEITPNPKVVGFDHGIEPLPIRIKVSRRRAPKVVR